MLHNSLTIYSIRSIVDLRSSHAQYLTGIDPCPSWWRQPLRVAHVLWKVLTETSINSSRSKPWSSIKVKSDRVS